MRTDYITWHRRRHLHVAFVTMAVALLASPSTALAAGSPWEDAVQTLATSFTGPIARGLSLVAIVMGGLIYAFDTGDSKRTIAGIVFGVGMAIGAASFMAWLFA